MNPASQYCKAETSKFTTLPGEREQFSPPLDPGIAGAVAVLRLAGIETFESCQGGPGHAYPEPTVRFHGYREEGFRALAAAIQGGLRVSALRRVWVVLDGEPTGPHWEMVFVGAVPPEVL
jgi:hypothetical protein